MLGGDGLRVRAMAYGEGIADEDLDLVADLVLALERGYLGRAESTRDELREELDDPQVRREHTLLVLEGEAAVAAAWPAYDESGRSVFLEVYVPPGREALREAVVDRLLLAARGLVGDRQGWMLRAGALAEETDYAALLRSHGFALVRRFWRMYVPAESAPGPGPLPAGVTVEPAVTVADRDAVWRVREESFAEHWNYVPRSYDEFWAGVTGSQGAVPENWWLLRVDGEPAAICLRNDCRATEGEAYVHVLGVRRGFRGRGLARLLLRRAFAAARDEGRAGTSLHVDSQNPTGATRLYESVGMRPVQVVDAYELPA